jgi:MGT family glycosyltransferase
MATGKKILFAPASTFLFHVGRSLGLARELKKRGHHIIFVGAPQYLQNPAIVPPGEFDYHELADFDTEQALEMLRDATRAPATRVVRAMVEAELALFKQLQPDLAVVDFRLTSYLTARVLGVPIVSLLMGLWMQQYAAIQPKIIRTFRHSRWLKQLLGEAGVGLVTPHALKLIIRYKTLPFARVAREYRVKPAKYLWDLLIGDLNLLLDTETWSPTKPLPPHFHRVGPILWEPDLPLPAWMEELDKSRPVIYVNFGSNVPLRLFQHIFAGFAETPYQVIVATGSQIEPTAFHIPANFYVEKFLPVSKIMELCDVVIYQGGAGTAYQVMRAGVPCLVIATHMDQEYQGMTTEQHKAGKFFTLQEVLVEPRLIVAAMKEILADLATYRQHAMRLQDDLRQYDGLAAAADRIQAFIEEGMPIQT